MITRRRYIPHTRTFSSTTPFRVTLRALSKGHHRKTFLEAAKAATRSNGPLPSNTRRNKARELPTDRRDRRARENNANHLVDPAHKRHLEIAAAREAEWINDPLRLAQRVLTHLKTEQGNGFDKALELVRASETHALKMGTPRGMLKNIVSWNHLMDWCMYNRDPASALKVYNEMKKRGHRPDSHTYTIMLRGFGDSIKRPNVVTDAMKVFDSISALNSDVKVNTIHLNAAVNVCARAGDMDALWSVVGRAPERGVGSVDRLTYTMILNALQKDIMKKVSEAISKARKDADADVSHIFVTAIEDGRKVWGDVIVKWRNAEINMDESLVCAMGRLLLMSKKKKDVMDVFRLVEQTMRIGIPKVPIQTRSEEGEEAEGNENEQEAALAVFEPVQSVKEVKTPEGPAKALYATPSTNSLSMLIEAATVTKQIHIAKAYWKLLTDPDGPYAIQSDVQNISAYLRLLRISRASRTALELLRHDWPESIKKTLYTRGTFVIAMSACVRDKNNPNVFDMASRILDIMQEKADEYLETEDQIETEPRRRGKYDKGANEEYKGHTLDLDPKIMTMYLGLAMYTTRGINPRLPLRKLPSGDLNFDRFSGTNNTFRALKRLGPNIINVRRMLKSRLAQLERESLTPRQRANLNRGKNFIDYNKTQERLEDLVGLFRGMISAYDRVLSVSLKLEDEGMGPLERDFLDDCRLNKIKLSTYLGQIDRQILDQMKLGNHGLWEGYDPMEEERGTKWEVKKEYKPRDETDTSYGMVDEEGRLIDDDDVVDDDMQLTRIPAMAKLRKEVNKEVKTVETQRENAKKWLSKRQKQEKEKARREDRLGRLYAGESRRVDGRVAARRSEHEFGQKGWGGGYDRMAQELGQRETSGFVELQR